MGVLEYPVLPLAFGQFVDVQYRLPGRGLPAVLIEGGAPPKTPGVVGVAPEVVPVFPLLPDVRNAFVGIEDVLEAVAADRETRSACKCVDGALIALAHPFEGGIAGYRFQPEIGVIVGHVGTGAGQHGQDTGGGKQASGATQSCPRPFRAV